MRVPLLDLEAGDTRDENPESGVQKRVSLLATRQQHLPDSA